MLDKHEADDPVQPPATTRTAEAHRPWLFIMAIKTQQRVSMRTIALKPALASAGISLRALPVGSGHALLGGALGHPQVIVALGEGTGGQRRRRRLPARVIVHHNVRRDLLHLRSCGPRPFKTLQALRPALDR